MKKILAGLLALMLLAGSALAEGFAPVNAPITIDGVRVAFFDGAGNYLAPMEKDGLIWAPLNALCENLGKEAQVQGQSVMVDGVRIGMFDEAGNFLMPQEVNGTVYVPAAAFCQSIGVEVQAAENGLAIRRAAAAPAAQAAPAPAPTAEPEPEHPEYVRMPLTDWNFWDYFRASITAENFKNYETKTKYGYQTLEFQHWSVDYVLTCTALTPYKFENVRFTASRNGNPNLSKYGVRKVTFSGQTMPQSGQLRQVKPYDDTYMAYSSYFSGNNLFETDFALVLLERDASVQNVSGNILIPWAEAQEMLETKYQSALTQMENKNYEAAVSSFEYLTEYAYKDAAQRLPEAKKALAEQKAQKQKDDYAAAQTAFDNGDWDTAIKGFKALGSYEDSKAKVTAATENKNSEAYDKAAALEGDGKYAEAIEAFKALGDYKDSPQRVTACENAKQLAEKRAAYTQAEEWEKAGEYINAYNGFSALADFEDSAERAQKLAKSAAIEEAELLAQEKKYDEVKTKLAPYKDHPDVVELYQTAVLRSADLVTAFNQEGWAVARGDQTAYCLLNITGETKTIDGDKYSGGWQDGLMRVETKEGYRYFDLKGDAAFEETFKEAERFYQGKALVTKKDGTVCVIDTTGQVVGRMPEAKGRTYETYMGEDLVRFKENGKLGLINLSGKVVVKAKYTKSISRFEFGLSVTCTQKGKKYAYSVINPKGKAVIKEGKYEIMGVMSEKLIACYLRNDNWGKGKTYPGLINLKGKTIVEGKYDNKEFHRVGDLIMLKRVSNSPKGTSTSWQIYDKEGKYVFGYTSDIRPLVSGDSQRVYIENRAGGVCQLSPIYQTNNYNRSLTDCRMDPQSPYIAMKKSDGWHVYDLALNLIN